MVQTRRQWQAWRDNGFESSQSSSSSESSHNTNDHAFDGGDEEPPEDHNGPGPYRPGDDCHRHRRNDAEPYTEEVTAYRRRRPVNH